MDDAFIDHRGMLRTRRFPPYDREKHVTSDIVARDVQRVHCREWIQSTALIQRMQTRFNESRGCNLSVLLNPASTVRLGPQLIFAPVSFPFLFYNQDIQLFLVLLSRDVMKMLAAENITRHAAVRRCDK